ncbi:MAG: hypothetical protein JRC90_11725 [Deltaproteobacteria bacterium]|nr:hypothetical protein [Deltaproteobacteria bacterium]
MARRSSFIGVKAPDVALQSALTKIQAAAPVWTQRTSEGFQRGWYAYYSQVAYPLFVRVASMINARGGKQALKAPVRSVADVARNYAAVGAPFAYAAHEAGRVYRTLVAQQMIAPTVTPYMPPAAPAPMSPPAQMTPMRPPMLQLQPPVYG